MIGDVTKGKIKEGLINLLDDYSEEIITAYINQDESLSISLNVKVSPHENSAVKVITSISFIESRIKGTIESIADEEQQTLPGM